MVGKISLYAVFQIPRNQLPSKQTIDRIFRGQIILGGGKVLPHTSPALF